MDQYTRYIEKCKAKKKALPIKNIVKNIIIGIRQGLNSTQLADKLNSLKVYTLMRKSWTPNSLQMQILKMARMDTDSTLAWGLATLIKEKFVNSDDISLLSQRARIV